MHNMSINADVRGRPRAARAPCHGRRYLHVRRLTHFNQSFPMQSPAIPFRLNSSRLDDQLHQFNARKEVNWFGFKGSFKEPGSAVITFTKFESGLQGGGGTAAINGGVIAAGFDAAFVLAGLGHYDSEVVVTLELSVKFLSLALVSESLAFQARVVRSARNFSFAEGFLSQAGTAATQHLAIATAMVAPVR